MLLDAGANVQVSWQAKHGCVALHEPQGDLAIGQMHVADVLLTKALMLGSHTSAFTALCAWQLENTCEGCSVDGMVWLVTSRGTWPVIGCQSSCCPFCCHLVVCPAILTAGNFFSDPSCFAGHQPAGADAN